jgi:CRP-like cAMP-binding protein
MTQHYVENLRYNDSGNEVSFELDHQRREANLVPGVFAREQEVVVHEGDVVFREGEESNFLYYIVSGRFNIYSSDKMISTLSADDIFLGEMSFLLNNRRSATVVAHGRGTLIKISKNAFVGVIKENPHYGIFLARLLAQRLSRLNAHVASLQQTADIHLG